MPGPDIRRGSTSAADLWTLREGDAAGTFRTSCWNPTTEGGGRQIPFDRTPSLSYRFLRRSMIHHESAPVTDAPASPPMGNVIRVRTEPGLLS